MSVFGPSVTSFPKPDYVYVTKKDQLDEAIEILNRYSVHAMDIEATALDPYHAKWTLLQVGAGGHTYVFDMRYDTEFSEIHPDMLEPLLRSPGKTRIFQNANYDLKVIKLACGYYLDGIYDTMLAEQLIVLGTFERANLAAIMFKYLNLTMDKEPRGTFSVYDQEFKPFQLEYAANDVVALEMIMDIQKQTLKKEGLENAARLEFKFLKPLCEMELNGICIDVDKWRIIMEEIDEERIETKKFIQKMFADADDQATLFGVSLINIDSNVQLKKQLNSMGLQLTGTSVKDLKKFKGLPIVDAILAYRKSNKLISTYAEPLLDRINDITGRLHTDFKQMVSTGRMSSSRPNLQNIPGKQKYRSCFIAKPGYSLVTADMSGAELRILGNLSQDPVFVDAYHTGKDLHTATGGMVYGVPYDKVESHMRKAAKAINFGLCYGMSAIGLAERLGITKKEAEKMMDSYFRGYKGVKKYLDKAGKDAVRNRYTETISGRRRYYNMPAFDHPDRQSIKNSIERQGKNAGIQGSNADTIKEAMILLVDRLEESGYDAKLVLTVHDEVVVEVKDDQKYEVSEIVAQSLVDGFGRYFSTIEMETDSLIGPCWLKSDCDPSDGGCGNSEMIFVADEKYGSKLVCKKCGREQ